MRQKKTTLRKPSTSANSARRESPTTAPGSWRVSDFFKTLTAILGFATAVLTVLVLYANNKGAFEELADDFYERLYEDGAWTGLFNNFPEGYVDMASMGLSDTSMQLVMIAKRGQIDGVIAERSLCAVDARSDYKLLRGDVSMFGRSATLVVWDVVSGHPKEYAELRASLDGVVLNLKDPDGSLWRSQAPLRLGKHPELDADPAMTALAGYCNSEGQGRTTSIGKGGGSEIEAISKDLGVRQE